MLAIGMNDCMSEPLHWDDNREYDRGKVLDAEALEALEEYGRYLDVDDDAITWRTLPGTHPEKGAFFTRGTSRDEYARYTEKGDAYERNMRRLTQKWKNAPRYLPEPVVIDSGHSIGIIHYGTSDASVMEARDQMQASGTPVDTLRLRSIPFHDSVQSFIDAHEQIFVVEQNRDGQMRAVIVSELNCDPIKLVSVLHFDGTPISAATIEEQISAVFKRQEQSAAHARPRGYSERTPHRAHRVPRQRMGPCARQLRLRPLRREEWLLHGHPRQEIRQDLAPRPQRGLLLRSGACRRRTSRIKCRRGRGRWQ